MLLAGPLLLPGAFAQTYNPEVQRRFIEGAQLLENGDYEGAARIFRTLVAATGSPRIKLELARTLFLQKRYAEARELFTEVLADPGVPWRVRENVEAYLRQIDGIIGYRKFSLSLVSDSNPRNITSQREFAIGGVRLTFQPPQDNEKVTGLRYSAQAFQPLLPESGLAAYASGSYFDYPGIALDRLTIDAGLARTLGESKRASAKAGVEAGTFGGKALYDFPYVGGGYVLSSSEAHRLNAELKLGRVAFPYYPYLDADYLSVTLAGTRTLTNATAMLLSGTAERSSAREDPYSYAGLTIGPGIVWLLSEPAVVLKAEGSLGKRRYDAIDPLFGARRVDHRTRLDLTLRSREWHWHGLHPALVLSVEENRSTLEFYSYRKLNLALAFE